MPPAAVVTTPDAAANIYPPFCHDASPTLPQWCPLRIADVHKLRDVEMMVPEVFGSSKLYRLYHYNNHPVKWVKIVGIVVAMDEFAGRKVYTIDDSSGLCIECSCIIPYATPDTKDIPMHLNQGAARGASTVGKVKKEDKDRKSIKKDAPQQSVDTPNVPYGLIDVGTVVRIKGRMSMYRDLAQVEVVSVTIVKETGIEVKFWNEARVFKTDVLSKEWVVGEREMEALREKEERRRRKRARKDREGKVSMDRRSRKNEISKGTSRDSVSLGKIPEQSRTVAGQLEKDEDAAKRMLEREMQKRAEKEDRKQRQHVEQGSEKKPRVAQMEDEKRIKKQKGLESLKNRPRYPSLAVRKAAAGKYDTLGF